MAWATPLSEAECDSLMGSSDGKGLADFVVVREMSEDGVWGEHFENLAESLYNEAVSKLKPAVTRAGMSRGSSAWSSRAVRGDSTCWITPDLCKELDTPSTAEFVKGMIKMVKPMKSHLNIDDYSVQFAVFPGRGEGYVRHKDSFSQGGKVGEEGDSLSKRGNRVITCLFYLNKSITGGNLRIYGRRVGDGVDEGESWEDIEPKFGKLVIFRSDFVEHEVLPCFSERLAFTLWASASSLSWDGTMTKSKSIANPISGAASARNPVRVDGVRSLARCTDTIFVGIASYRDTECQHTIRDLFEQAQYPERVYIGIVWQCDRSSDGGCFEIERDLFKDSVGTRSALGQWWQQHVRILEMPWQQARGPCIARHIAGSLWRGEKYFLQIDSHMRFRGNWDSAMVQLLEDARCETKPKPILTTYPLGYTLPNNVPDDRCATYLVPTNFDRNGILRQSGRRLCRRPREIEEAKLLSTDTVRVLPSLLWASGFSFSDASLLQEVPYDPQLEFLFFGEEVSMAARLFTHGYDFFAPTEAIVYHLWSRDHRPTFQQAQTDTKREAMKARSLKRVRALLGLTSSGDRQSEPNDHDHAHDDNLQVHENKQIVLDAFGLGSVRSLGDFEQWACVDLKSGKVGDGLGRHLDKEWAFVDEVEVLIAEDQKGGKDAPGKIEALNLVMSYLQL